MNGGGEDDDLVSTTTDNNDSNLLTTSTSSKRKRRRRDGVGGGSAQMLDSSVVGENFEAPADEQRTDNKTGLTEIITSLLLLEDQEKCDNEEWGTVSQNELSFIQSNHKKKVQTMLDYYSSGDIVQSRHDETDHLLRRKRSRDIIASAITFATTAAEIIIDKEEETTSKPGSAAGGGQQQQQQRRLWVKDRSKAWWDECNSPEFPEEDFRKAFRMGKSTFDMICEELNSVVAKEDTMLRAAIPVRQRVAVCIWRLATGEPLRLVSKRFGLGISTCHKLVLEVCTAIRTVLMPKYLQWPDDSSLRRIKEEFESISGIPNVVGSIYTTHIPIIAPKISVGAYFNKRHTERNQKTSYSITVQGVVNPNGVFTDVCIGWPGSMPDDKVLEKSHLYQRAGQGHLKGVWVVGGSGYPLMDWVLVPYSQQNLTWTQHAFNEKVGEIQRISRGAFARLKGRWSCLQKRTEVKLQDLPVVLGACCVLHNICEMNGEKMDSDIVGGFELIDDEMIPDAPLRSVSSMKARDSIAHNLLHHGLAGTGFL